MATRSSSPMQRCELSCRPQIGDYTDFYASIHHATNVGSMFRPDNPLLPNYKWVPIGYHGRASSIVSSGTTCAAARPNTRRRRSRRRSVRRGDWTTSSRSARSSRGQRARHRRSRSTTPRTRVRSVSRERLVGARYPGVGVSAARAVPREELRDDRFAVGRDARCARAVPRAGVRRAPEDPAPLPYLFSDANEPRGGFESRSRCSFLSERMRDARHGAIPGERRRVHRHVLDHRAAHRAPREQRLQSAAGDLLASGTVSGPTKESRGSCIERTWRGTEPLALPTGETRAFLEDGDEVIMRGYCEREGHPRIGFGECRGRVAPADPI